MPENIKDIAWEIHDIIIDIEVNCYEVWQDYSKHNRNKLIGYTSNSLLAFDNDLYIFICVKESNMG